MTQEIPLYQIDAFTAEPFRGNPAAVCLLQFAAETEWMQAVAAEMNLSETAFVHPQEEGFGLRWFTPTVEVDLCGHGTLAAVQALVDHGWLKPGDPVQFDTRSGVLCSEWDESGITLDFPRVDACEGTRAGLADAIGVKPLGAYRSRDSWMVELDSVEAVRNLRPNLSVIASLVPHLLIVTAKAEQDDVDFVSRVFAPASGIAEDPATGSAHCLLAPFWQERMGKDSFRVLQLSERGGEIFCECRGERVILKGQAVTVFRGNLHV